MLISFVILLYASRQGEKCWILCAEVIITAVPQHKTEGLQVIHTKTYKKSKNKAQYTCKLACPYMYVPAINALC